MRKQCILSSQSQKGHSLCREQKGGELGKEKGEACRDVQGQTMSLGGPLGILFIIFRALQSYSSVESWG